MTTRYTKTTLLVVDSANSDYSRTYPTSYEDTFSATRVMRDVVPVTDSGYTVPVTGFTTVDKVVLKNNDADEFIVATYDSVGTENCTQKLLGGSPPVQLVDISTAADLVLTTDTGKTASCDIWVFGT